MHGDVSCIVMFHVWWCFMHGDVFPKQAWQLIVHQPCHTASTLSTWLAPSLAATHAATHSATQVCGHPGRVGEGEQQDVISCVCLGVMHIICYLPHTCLRHVHERESNKMLFLVFWATSYFLCLSWRLSIQLIRCSERQWQRCRSLATLIQLEPTNLIQLQTSSIVYRYCLHSRGDLFTFERCFVYIRYVFSWHSIGFWPHDSVDSCWYDPLLPLHS